MATLMLFTVQDPRQKIDEQDQVRGQVIPSNGSQTLFSKSSGPLFGVMGISGIHTFVMFNVGPWTPVYLMRHFHMAPSQAGLFVGTALLICGVTGSVIGGFIGERFTKDGRSGQKLRAAALGLAVMIPSIAGLVLSGSRDVAMGFFVLFLLSTHVCYASIPAALQDIVPARLRGRAAAMQVVVNGLVGISFGTTAVALVTDHVFHDDLKVGYSILAVAIPATVVCLVWTCLMLRPYSRRYAAERDRALIR